MGCSNTPDLFHPNTTFSDFWDHFLSKDDHCLGSKHLRKKVISVQLFVSSSEEICYTSNETKKEDACCNWFPKTITICMEYDCHIFAKYLVFQMKNLVFQLEYLAFRLKTLDFKQNTRHFEWEMLMFFYTYDYLELKTFVYIMLM